MNDKKTGKIQGWEEMKNSNTKVRKAERYEGEDMKL